ncbi:MAG: dihydroorotase family protein [Thermoplasmata archaeon]|nr:dihydroorotase family protein [Thermoplasmata archaeon]
MTSPARAPPAENRPSAPEVAAWVLAGRAFVRGRLQSVELGISEDGMILSVGKDRSDAPRHDVGEGVILPSATDLHVHFREPGGPEGMESIATGTTQAAIGGVGLVGEMPNTEPPVTDVEHLREKEDRVRGSAVVDVLLYASPTRPRALDRLATRAGAFKLYLSPTTGIDTPPDRAALGPLLARLAELGLPVAVHAEDPTRFSAASEAKDPVTWDSTRPPVAERAAIEHLLSVAPPSLRLHLAHVTETESVDRLRAAGVSFEATPHHLLLSERSRSDALTKVNPPLRSEKARRALWECFLRGEIPCVASDHAPHSLAAKERPFPLAPSGMPGTETLLPLLLPSVRSGILALPTLVAAACDRPARWLGQPQGRLAPGHRANLLVVDFRQRSRIDARKLHAPCGWTAFEGWEAIFPREHYFHGQKIVDDGEFVGRPTGVVVRPEFAPRPR